MRISSLQFVLVAVFLFTGLCGFASASGSEVSTLDGCNLFPADNIWNARVDQLPLDPMSAVYISSISAQGNQYLHPDFGTVYNGAPNGIPYISVPATQPLVPIVFDAYGDESDPGPYRTPLDAPIEGGPDSTGDRHVLSIDHDNCILYELYRAFPGSNSWTADSGAVYDLNVNGPLRTDGWTSADAAGLPMLPGLVRYDEVTAGAIQHAIRFTAPLTQNVHIWPARHDAGHPNLSYPPMGARLRLKADYDISGFPTPVQVILQALKTYGMILADNGSGWFLSGAPDPSWDDNVLHQLTTVPGSAFDVVDTSVLMIDPNSGQARSWPPPPLWSDDFEDNDVSDWTHLKGTWAAAGGMMTGTFNKKADNFPQGFTAGCSNCIIEADMQVDTPGARVSLLGWYQDKSHYVELRLMDDKNKVLLKQYSGSASSKKSAPLTITAGTNYHVRMRYSGGKIVAEVGSLAPLVITPRTTPSGTVGFRIKSTNGSSASASFQDIVVY